MTNELPALSPSDSGPPWLTEDLLRVENLLIDTAGASSHPMVSEPSLHLIKAGGKRLRPALVLLSSRSGNAGRLSTDLAAAAIELVHIATLYHDDFIDETETRRGVPTAHSKWGAEVAVLAGDYLFACGCGLGARAGEEASAILSKAIADVCEGQIVETAALGQARRDVDEYIGTIRRKTAALFQAACALGVATAAADGDRREALLTYGENLGLAFQIVDDLLDLVGDVRVTGKDPGTDLRAGVFTVPVLIACQREPALADRLHTGERDLDVVLPFLFSTGALDDAYGFASSYGRRAVAALEAVPPCEWKDVLEGIVDAVLAQVA